MFIWVRIKLGILAFLLFIFLGGAVELSFRFLDGKIQFREQVLWQYRNATDGEKYLETIDPFSGLGPTEIPIRAADSENARGYFRNGKFEKNLAHSLANQEVVTPEKLGSPKKVFVIGESAAFGFPLTYDESLSSRLENKLSSKNIQVVNAAQPGIISYAAIDLTDRILEFYNPTALIYYLGNNLWISWRPPLSRQKVWALKGLSLLAESRTLAWLEYVFSRRLERAILPLPVNNMHEIYAGIENPLISPTLNWPEVQKRHLDVFRNKLTLQIQKAKQKNVRVVLMGVPFNYKVSPYRTGQQLLAEKIDQVPEMRRRLLKADSLIRETHLDEALELIEALITKEPHTPFPYYLKGMALEKKREFVDAERAYTLARDYTLGNLGSLPTVNRVIKQTAQALQVDFIDLQEIFDQESHAHGNYFNEDLFVDDCHPSSRGQQLISEALAKVLR